MSFPSATPFGAVSMVLSKGIYLVNATVAYDISLNVLTYLMIRSTGSPDFYVRSTMSSGGGMFVSKIIDARNNDIGVKLIEYQGHTSAVNGKISYEYIKL